MELYIVRIKSYIGDECIENGTGIIISNNLVLTAKHLVKGDINRVIIDNTELEAEILQPNNNVAVLLRVVDDIEFTNIASVFTNDEILDNESKWTVNGFITAQLINHSMSGVGIVCSDTEESNWNYYLATISTGKSNNYSGLSGSPVFCNNRIIGILQMQSTNINGALGVRMASVKMFAKMLNDNNIKGNEYVEIVRDKCIEYSLNQIEKNIKSRKYIPNIFVEESAYKENLRYFSEPSLFLKKAINDVKQINFTVYNKLLSAKNEKIINFNYFNLDFKLKDLESICSELYFEINYAKEKIEELEKLNYSDIKNDVCSFYNLRQNGFNNSIKYFLGEIKENLLFTKKKYLLLTKDAGQGKTNFLCDFTLNFLIKKKYIVLYFNAYDVREKINTYISEILSLFNKYSLLYVDKVLKKEWENTKKPVVIVIDGLNENTVIYSFGQAIKEFLEECQRYPYIKVIMTTRNEFLKERFGALEDGTYSDVYMHINMFSRSDKFKDRIFKGYLKFFNITIRNSALSSKSYYMLTSDILLLRFFCEINENKKQIYLYDIYKYEVFEQYLEKKALEYCTDWKAINSKESFYLLLDKISEYMITNKEFFNVPTNIIASKDESELLAMMLSNDVIFKDEQIIKQGMLPRVSAVISFTFDEFRDFCITNYILTHYFEKEKFIMFWNNMDEENLTIKEGVQKYVFYLGRTRSQEKLLPIIKELPEYEELYWEYIWGLEDKYITIEDKEKWKQQVLENEKYEKRVVHDLIMKFDTEYFSNINIGLLFDILDQLSNNIGAYEQFIKKMFGVYYEDKYKLFHDRTNVVLPYNRMIENIRQYIDDNDWNIHHKELYRLSIYLLELKNWAAKEMWIELFESSPEVVIELLTNMNNHKSSIINGNVKDILQSLKNHQRNDKFDNEIIELYNVNNFCQDICIDIDNILNIFKEI